MKHLELILSALLLSLMSFVGILIQSLHPKIRRYIDNSIHELNALSAGIIFLMSIFLAKKAIYGIGWKMSVLFFLLGIVFYILIHKVSCEKHSPSQKRKGIKVLIGDSIHNIADGIMLSTFFHIGKSFGFLALFSMLLHEFPQEISKYFILKESGLSSWKASFKSFWVALTVFIGVFLGIVFEKIKNVHFFFLAVASSFFLGLIFHDLVPLSEFKKKKQIRKFFFLGVILMFFIAQIIHFIQNH